MNRATTKWSDKLYIYTYLKVLAVPEHLHHIANTLVLCIWEVCGLSRYRWIYPCWLVCNVVWWWLKMACVLWQKRSSLCGPKSERCTGDYGGLLWTNKSVPRLCLFKQITANTVWRTWALAFEVPALKANNGVTHIHNPSQLEDTSAVCFHVAMTLVAYSGN